MQVKSVKKVRGKAVNVASIHDWPGHARHPALLAARKHGRRKWVVRPHATQCLRATRYCIREPEGTGGVLIGRQRREPQ